MNNILEQIATIIRETTQNSKAEIDLNTTASDVQGWDSLMHIYIISKTEKHFKIKLTATEAHGLKTVGDFCSLIGKKIG